MVDVLTIENEHWRIGFSPATGGSITSGQVRIGDAWVDVLRPTPENLLGEWWDTASYPLIPWSNRIRHSTLLWKGEGYQLRPWKTEDYAMHGTVVEYPWEVDEKGDDYVKLSFDARGYYGVNFPWDFVAHQEYRLEGKRLTVVTAVENVDDVAFPAGLGHHPYLLRQLHLPDGAPVGDVVNLQVNATKAYELENYMPTEGPKPLTPRIDFREMRDLGTVLVDDCFAGRTGRTAAIMKYGDALTLTMDANDICQHIVLYIPTEGNHFALEAVTNANDGFTLFAKGIEGAGVFEVPVGETVAAEFSLTID